MNEKHKIQPDTIARTIILAIALFNQALSIAGRPVLPIEDELIESLVSYAFTFVATIVAWWHNNSFSQAALKGDKVMDELKALKKQKEAEKE